LAPPRYGIPVLRRLMSLLVRLVVVAPLLLLIGGPRSGLLLPVLPESITITSAPVTLQADVADRTRTGQLTLLGGWQLDAPRSRQFGGWSALRVEGDRFTVIGDYGSVLRFRLTRFGRAVDARIDPLPNGCGRQDDKRERDSESLATASGGWWIGYEADNRLCRVTRTFTRATALRRPPEMVVWREKYGAEALLRLVDGRYLAFAERGPTDAALRPLLIFSGDPADPRTTVTRHAYKPPPGFSPTDAAQLPDGRVLVLNRRFGFATLFTSALVAIDLTALTRSAPVTGTVVARLSPPALHDNFEGLDVSLENGRPIIWMISDDNFMSWQSTYLLKFALDPSLAATP
jgi:hypothetical protein